MKPLRLRLLAEKHEDKWFATCIDLYMVSEGKTSDEAFESLKEMLIDHIQVVLETDDPLSIPSMLNLPAPLSIRLKFRIAEIFHIWKSLKINFYRPTLPSKVCA